MAARERIGCGCRLSEELSITIVEWRVKRIEDAQVSSRYPSSANKVAALAGMTEMGCF